MSEIESAITELLDALAKRCPQFQPSIFPFKYSPKKVEDLVNSKTATSSEFIDWLSSVTKDLNQVTFKTKVTYSERNVEIVELKVRYVLFAL